MKKIFGYVLLLGVLLIFVSCSTTKLETMKYDDSNPPHLLWYKNEYSYYGIISEDNVIGKQIGTVTGLRNSKVFELKEQSSQKWLVVADSDEMTVYVLYKETSVLDIPSDLKKYRQ